MQSIATNVFWTRVFRIIHGAIPTPAKTRSASAAAARRFHVKTGDSFGQKRMKSASGNGESYKMLRVRAPSAMNAPQKHAA